MTTRGAACSLPQNINLTAVGSEQLNGTILSDADGASGAYLTDEREQCDWTITCPGSHPNFAITNSNGNFSDSSNLDVTFLAGDQSQRWTRYGNTYPIGYYDADVGTQSTIFKGWRSVKIAFTKKGKELAKKRGEFEGPLVGGYFVDWACLQAPCIANIPSGTLIPLRSDGVDRKLVPTSRSSDFNTAGEFCHWTIPRWCPTGMFEGMHDDVKIKPTLQWAGGPEYAEGWEHKSPHAYSSENTTVIYFTSHHLDYEDGPSVDESSSLGMTYSCPVQFSATLRTGVTLDDLREKLKQIFPKSVPNVWDLTKPEHGGERSSVLFILASREVQLKKDVEEAHKQAQADALLLMSIINNSSSQQLLPAGIILDLRTLSSGSSRGATTAPRASVEKTTATFQPSETAPPTQRVNTEFGATTFVPASATTVAVSEGPNPPSTGSTSTPPVVALVLVLLIAGAAIACFGIRRHHPRSISRVPSRRYETLDEAEEGNAQEGDDGESEDGDELREHAEEEWRQEFGEVNKKKEDADAPAKTEADIGLPKVGTLETK